MSKIILKNIVPAELAEKRLDQALNQLFPEYSRERFKQWIKAGFVLVDGKIMRPRDKVFANQEIIIKAEAEVETASEPQLIPLDVIYSDQDIIIINKPIGLVMHPGAGCKKNTLLNALLYHYPELAKVPRAGIVHRLDKDTSGLIVVARNLTTQTALIKAMQKREIKREYVAIVTGTLTAGGKISAPIGRHKTKRTLMAVTETGKPAVTHYRVLERFLTHTYLKVMLETGRTHQIRVHLAHLHHPIVGDQVYGKNKLLKNISQELAAELAQFKHQALHAYRLSFAHPSTHKNLEFSAPMPEDMQNLLKTLRESSS